MTTASKSLMDCLKSIRPIEADIFKKAEKESVSSNIPMEQLLKQQGVVSDIDLVLATADYLEIRPISLANFTADTSLIELMPKDKWIEYMAVPICRMGFSPYGRHGRSV